MPNHLNPPGTPRQQITDQAAQGRSVSEALANAIIAERPDNWSELVALTMRLQLCNSHSNLWTATDLHSQETGEMYNGSGRFWACNSKLCPYCVKKQSRRNRANLTRVLENERRLHVGEYFHHIVLTMPNLGIPLLKAREIMHRAWTLLRKRKWFRETIIGGSRSEEFTITRLGIHYHQHNLVKSKYLSYVDLRSNWTSCLNTAWLSVLGYELTPATSDKLAVAHVSRVGNIEQGVQEVCKYITKSDSWQKLRTADLIQVASIRRFPRMFDLFGSFAEERQRLEVLRASVDELRRDPRFDGSYLDTECISDGTVDEGESEHWRDVGADVYLGEIFSDFGEMIELRKQYLKSRFQYATFQQVKERIPLDRQRFEDLIWACTPPQGISFGSYIDSFGTERWGQIPTTNH